MKTKVKGWTPEEIKSLIGKKFVITGATSGAGYEATRILLAKGAEVIMLNRNEKKSLNTINMLQNEFGNDVKVSFIQMDLAQLDSVRNAARKLRHQVDQIDALLCNAAIAQVAKQEITIDGFESQLGVNHYGHFLLTGLVFDIIEKSQGRIVIVGSNGYRMGEKRIKFEDMNFNENYSPWNSYAQSKLAQMMFGFELQRRIEKTNKNIQVYVCHPGASRTNLLQDTANKLQKSVWAVMSIFAQSAEKGSWPEVMCATSNNLQSAKYYGPTRFDMVGPVGESKLEEFALDEVMAQKLWKVSEEATKFNWEI